VPRQEAGEKLHTLAWMLAAPGRAELYRRMLSHGNDPAAWLRDPAEPPVVVTDPGLAPRIGDFRRWMMTVDGLSFLADDILVKADRASMGVSLEARVPLLDHRVVEFAAHLPERLTLRGRETKWILRRVLDRYLPASVVDRPKQGFTVPVDAWLRGALRAWAEPLLDEGRLKREGFFNPAAVRAAWAEHQSGRRDHAHRLWNVLMFQAWLERQTTRPA